MIVVHFKVFVPLFAVTEQWKMPVVVSPIIEPLDRRTHLSATLTAQGLLQVAGGTGNDVITLTREGSLLRVTIDSQSLDQTFALSAVQNYEITGLSGNDQLLLDDTVSVPGTLLGGDGDDTLRGGAGADTFNVGLGADTVDYSARTGAMKLSVDSIADDGLPGEGDNLLLCIETIIGGSGNDRIKGCPTNNLIFGNGGKDTIDGVSGNDTVSGGNGNDIFTASAGNDSYFGSGGRDTVDYSAESANLTLSIDGIANDGTPGETDNVAGSIENLVGGAGADIITGNGRANVLIGNGGNDQIFGGSGEDQIIGGGGEDLLSGQAGTDELIAGDGEQDIVSGGSGIDTLTSSDEVDMTDSVP